MRAALTLLAVPLALAALLVAATAPALAAPPAAVRHVWVIVLENQDASTSFGPSSPAPYLAHTLPSMGQYLPNYYGIGHASNDNYIAMISGQGPNTMTQSDCQLFTDFQPATPGPNGQAMGQGCVYPSSVHTVADQLNAAGRNWRAYQEDMGNTPTREPSTCAHPAIGSHDATQTATAADQYATRHNPFVYFHSIIDSPTCQQNVVPLTRLSADLQSVAATPSFSFITPNLCHDGHDSPCADGEPGGLQSANTFLSQIVPQITASPAYRHDGLLVVAFDESATGAQSCCGEDQDALAANGSNTANPGGSTPGTGGGLVGAVLLSPFITPATVNPRAFNHYSLLASIEDIFGLPRLGFAGVAGLPTFGSDVFQRAASTTSPLTGGCVARSLRGARGRLGRGALIAGARLLRGAGGRRTLLVSVTRVARLDVSVRRGARRVRLRSRVLRACRAYRIVLPATARRGSLVVQASVRGARERRRLALTR